MHHQPYAKVILDSVSPFGRRITTIEARYWRAIHCEVLTHRDRARNAASSRAIPFSRVAATIRDEPYIPEFLGAEKKGMQAGEELQGADRQRAIEAIHRMRLACSKECQTLHELGLHKSIINRYLEPWSCITVVMTATEWRNFFRLRIHPNAERHFAQVAGMIRDAIKASVPRVIGPTEWHMPYLRPEDWEEVRSLSLADQRAMIESYDHMRDGTPSEAILCRISAARCARVSYLTHDGRRDIRDDLRLFNTLIHPKTDTGDEDDVIHASPLEHVATPFATVARSGPFVGWQQFRKVFVNENVPG